MKRGQLSAALALSSVAAVVAVIHLGTRYIIIASAISPQRRSFCARLRRSRVFLSPRSNIMCHRRSFSVIVSSIKQVSTSLAASSTAMYICICILYYIIYIVRSSSCSGQPYTLIRLGSFLPEERTKKTRTSRYIT